MQTPDFSRPYKNDSDAELNEELAYLESQLVNASAPAAAMIREDIALVKAEKKARQ